jgi:hypothetical protein
MIVTLDAFSGRPNPIWQLSEKDSAQLLERISGRAVQAAAADESATILGFRGFIVAAASDDEMPDTASSAFRVGGPMPAQAVVSDSRLTEFSASEWVEVSRFLLNTGRHVLDAGLMMHLEALIPTQAQPAPIADETLWMVPAEPAPEEELLQGKALDQGVAEDVALAAACVIANTRYNPGFWNRPGVQEKNNCYNFAMNWRSDTFAQPGRISGHPYSAINCAAIGTAANWDGCHTYCSGSNKNVALVIAPRFAGDGPDYHWYRRQREGFWAHKPGPGAATNKDNLGRLIDGRILTPANCARGDYTIFCGYRFSPTGMRVR